jgi:hypothetical protein
LILRNLENLEEFGKINIVRRIKKVNFTLEIIGKHFGFKNDKILFDNYEYFWIKHVTQENAGFKKLDFRSILR